MRTPTPRYFPSRGAYYCQIKGVQQHLATGPKDEPDGPTYLAALQRFNVLMQLHSAGVRQDRNTPRVILKLWFDEESRHWAESTLKNRKSVIAPFVEALGDIPLVKLTPLDVSMFLDRMSKPRRRDFHSPAGKECHRTDAWGEYRRIFFRQTWTAALRWAHRWGYLPPLPEALFHRGREVGGSRQSVLKEGEDSRLLAAARFVQTRALVEVLLMTGARPGEIAGATGRDYDPKEGAIIYPPDDRRAPGRFRHKTAGKGKERVIMLEGDVKSRAERRAAQAPDAPLWPNRDGKPFNISSIAALFKWLRKKTGIAGLTAYTLRHTFATRRLLAGMPVEMLAALMGNTPAVIYKHYGHLLKDRGALRKALERYRPADGDEAK